MIRLERTIRRDPDVGGLLVGELGELRSDLGKVQAGNFLVEVLRKHGDLPGS